MPYIYMVRCEDGSLYTGIARDVRRRIQEHYYRKKSGAKYTKSHQVCALEMVWETKEWSDAAKLEYWIKQLGKCRKETLILHPEQVSQLPGLCPEEKQYQPHPEMNLAMCLKEDGEDDKSGATEKTAFFSDGA